MTKHGYPPMPKPFPPPPRAPERPEQNEPVTVSLKLGKMARYSEVFINGVDVTHSVMGVEVRAFVNELSVVTLTLSPRVEIYGEVGELLKAIPECPKVEP